MTSGQPGGGQPDDTTPADPITPLVGDAAALHEMYLSYIAGGFTAAQALYLVAMVLHGMAMKP